MKKNSAFVLLALSFCLGVSASALEYSRATETDVGHLQKLRAVKPVLLNILYRGGGPGGQVKLPDAALTSLCKAGFSSAVYLYPEKINVQPITCTDENGKTNQLKYHMISFRDVRSIFSEIHRSVTSNAGPMFVHCWNGWHASGEVAAKALMQFCGWSGAEAAEYWADNIGDKGNLPKYGSIKKRVADFKPFDDLKLSAQAQAEMCPQKRGTN